MANDLPVSYSNCCPAKLCRNKGKKVKSGAHCTVCQLPWHPTCGQIPPEVIQAQKDKQQHQWKCPACERIEQENNLNADVSDLIHQPNFYSAHKVRLASGGDHSVLDDTQLSVVDSEKKEKETVSMQEKIMKIESQVDSLRLLMEEKEKKQEEIWRVFYCLWSERWPLSLTSV